MVGRFAAVKTKKHSIRFKYKGFSAHVLLPLHGGEGGVRFTAPMSKPTIPEIYFPPPFLAGVITDAQYRKWLTRKAKYIIAQDRARKRACVHNATERQYKQSIHTAVTNAGQFDPFTGEKLQWQLVCTWNDANAKNLSEAVFKTFALLPTVDHIDPYATAIDFEYVRGTLIAARTISRRISMLPCAKK